MQITIPSHLSDTELVAEVTRCAQDERGSTAHLVAHLAEFDARRLHLGAGFPSLFAYCCEVLRLSEHATYNRIEAARAARRFPVILDRLAEGSLNLTTVRLLAPHLTEDNHDALLTAALHRSKREVEELLARECPRSDVPSSVRKVPERRPTSASAPAAVAPVVVASAQDSLDGPFVPAPPSFVAPASVTSVSVTPLFVMPSPTVKRPLISPLATDRYEFRFTGSAATRDKLKVLRDLLRHAVPNGDAAEIFDRALTALLEKLARQKLAVVRKPQPKARPSALGSRHVPSAVKRAVWMRDGGRCAFLGTGGHRCSERAFLEYHHVTPYGVGGEATVSNIQLRCRSHNGYESELFYGRPRGGADVVRESRPNYAVAWGFELVPGRVGSPGNNGRTADMECPSVKPRSRGRCRR